MEEKKINLKDFFFESMQYSVSYNYIPKLENKIGIENVNFVSELKTIEKAHSLKYLVLGFNALYIYLYLDQKLYTFKKVKPLMIILIPVSIYSYGVTESRKESKKIIDPLFQEDFIIYKQSKSLTKPSPMNYLNCK